MPCLPMIAVIHHSRDILERCMTTCGKAAGVRAKRKSRARKQASTGEILGDNVVVGSCPHHSHSGESTPAFMRRFRLSHAASKWKPPRPWDHLFVYSDFCVFCAELFATNANCTISVSVHLQMVAKLRP